jgi:hypothetical protein
MVAGKEEAGAVVVGNVLDAPCMLLMRWMEGRKDVKRVRESDDGLPLYTISAARLALQVL